MALTKALQSCAQWSSGLYHVLYSAASDLQEYTTNLMLFTEEDILDAMLLEPVNN